MVDVTWTRTAPPVAGKRRLTDHKEKPLVRYLDRSAYHGALSPRTLEPPSREIHP